MTEQTENATCMEVPCEIKAANILKKLDDNPGLRPATTEILARCEQKRQEEVALLEDVHEALAAKGELPVQPLSAVVALLVREGALVEQLEVDGKPYEGTIEDAFLDETIPENAQTLIYESTTEAGSLVLAQDAPIRRAENLFDLKPEHAQAFKRTLQLCSAEGGLSTADLGEALDAEGFLQRDAQTNIPRFYPSMFANFLKDAGCIEWRHGWVTTDLGRQIAAA